MSSYLLPEAYLPHRPPMILLDEVRYVDDQQVKCSVKIHPHSSVGPFLNKQLDLPAWFGIELIAQTIGVWSGWHHHLKQEEKARVGMLLGARKYKSECAVFKAGSQLTIKADLLLQDDQLGSFDGTIFDENEHDLVQARITVLRPTESQLHQILGKDKK